MSCRVSGGRGGVNYSFYPPGVLHSTPKKKKKNNWGKLVGNLYILAA